jgi:hypothetical protein
MESYFFSISFSSNEKISGNEKSSPINGEKDTNNATHTTHILKIFCVLDGKIYSIIPPIIVQIK